LGTPGSLAGGLDSRQQECDQDADDGDYDKKLNERECASTAMR
jgi:hypothetical protein